MRASRFAENTTPIISKVPCNGAVLRKVFDDLGSEQRGVGGEAEVDVLAGFVRATAGVVYGLTQHGDVHERLSTEKCQVDVAAPRRLFDEVIDRCFRRFNRHELWLALWRRDAIFAELVAILAREIALIREVEHQRLQGERRGRALHRFFGPRAVAGKSGAHARFARAVSADEREDLCGSVFRAGMPCPCGVGAGDGDLNFHTGLRNVQLFVLDVIHSRPMGNKK